MLALIRIVKNLREREHYLRTRYHRDHPHFLLYIALDAILSITLVGGGYAVASSNGVFDRNPQILADLGATALTESQLVSQVRSHGVSVDWLGALNGARYSTQVMSHAAVTINYLSTESSRAVGISPFLSIRTYSDPSAFDYVSKGPIHSAPDIKIFNSLGDQITYNPSELDEIRVDFKSGKRIVVIQYSEPQSVFKLVQASEQLHPVI